MIMGRPSSHTYTRKEIPHRGMGPKKLKNHRGGHVIDYAILGTRLEGSFEPNMNGAP
jgi:hypothetical protein